jgi:tetratricopeptide (TPR) repeat protein
MAEIKRALLLLQQARFDLAEQELRQVLIANPNDAQAHALLSICLLRKEDFATATEEAQVSIGLAPDWAYPHFCLSQVMQARNRLDEAEASAREAVHLEPEDADYWGQLSSVHMAQRRWKDALSAADEGLSHDPEDAECANLRTMALSQLGRGADAAKYVDETLAKHPENAYSHAAKGWALLHENKPKEALEHFRESLRLNPTLDFARSGMIEALKARNPIYRVMLGYFLWMGRLSSQVQWGVIVGLYFAQRILSSVAKNNPALAPFVRPLLILYVVFAMLTWFAMPLFNLLLRFNKYGKHALSRDQRMATNWFAACMALVAGGFGYAAWSGTDLAFLLGGFGLTMALPLVTIFSCDVGWPRNAMKLYAGGMAVFGLYIISACLTNDPRGENLIGPYVLVSFLATPLVANYFSTQTVRK